MNKAYSVCRTLRLRLNLSAESRRGRFAEALNEQIAYEYAASQQYVAIAVHYDAESLPQLAAHFYRQAVEERNHAMMMVQFLLDADEAVDIPGVEAPKTDFGDAREPVALALEQEKRSPTRSSRSELAREEGSSSASSSSTGSSRSSARRSRRCRTCSRPSSGRATTC